MATADRNFWTGQATIASTSYPAVTAPSLDGSTYIGGGAWSIVNPSATVSMYVSFDGTNDAVIIPPGLAWNSPSSVCPAKVWLKGSAATSTVITGTLCDRQAMEGDS